MTHTISIKSYFKRKTKKIDSHGEAVLAIFGQKVPIAAQTLVQTKELPTLVQT